MCVFWLTSRSRPRTQTHTRTDAHEHTQPHLYIICTQRGTNTRTRPPLQQQQRGSPGYNKRPKEKERTLKTEETDAHRYRSKERRQKQNEKTCPFPPKGPAGRKQRSIRCEKDAQNGKKGADVYAHPCPPPICSLGNAVTMAAKQVSPIRGGTSLNSRCTGRLWRTRFPPGTLYEPQQRGADNDNTAHNNKNEQKHDLQLRRRAGWGRKRKEATERSETYASGAMKKRQCYIRLIYASASSRNLASLRQLPYVAVASVV